MFPSRTLLILKNWKIRWRSISNVRPIHYQWMFECMNVWMHECRLPNKCNWVDEIILKCTYKYVDAKHTHPFEISTPHVNINTKWKRKWRWFWCIKYMIFSCHLAQVIFFSFFSSFSHFVVLFCVFYFTLTLKKAELMT